MPTRNNPNLPSSLNKRVLSHRRISVRARSRASAPARRPTVRSEPTAPRTVTFAGCVRGKTISTKKSKKVVRNRNYALERKKEDMAMELLKKAGEVEMQGALAKCRMRAHSANIKQMLPQSR